jgi:hypothetical protein
MVNKEFASMNPRKPCLRLIKGESSPPEGDLIPGQETLAKSQISRSKEEEQKARIAKKPLIRFLNSYCDAIDREIAQILDL